MTGGSWSVGLGLAASHQTVCAASVPPAVNQLIHHRPGTRRRLYGGCAEPMMTETTIEDWDKPAVCGHPVKSEAATCRERARCGLALSAVTNPSEPADVIVRAGNACPFFEPAQFRVRDHELRRDIVKAQSCLFSQLFELGSGSSSSAGIAAGACSTTAVWLLALGRQPWSRFVAPTWPLLWCDAAARLLTVRDSGLGGLCGATPAPSGAVTLLSDVDGHI
jgi:hypothetical protein